MTSNQSDAQIIKELEDIAYAEKAASDNPEWAIISERSNSRLQLTCPLWVDGAITLGLKLELMGPHSIPSNRPFMGFKALMFATHVERIWHLGRIEFDPEAPIGPHHINPPDAHNFPATVTGAHVHSFRDNKNYGLDALSPKRNLPIAVPLDRIIDNYNDILSTIREYYIIPDLWLEEPIWSRTLL